MITRIIEKLKTGPIKNVVPYGTVPLPSAPYVVVRTEADGLGRGRIFRIFVHYLPGQIIWLEDYVFGYLTTALRNYEALSRHGNRNMLLTQQDYKDIIPNKDDGTISMERRFLMPSRFF
jgi:hypothetical protein